MTGRRVPLILISFLIATLLPAVALAWLGWRVVIQDRDLERQRVHDFLASTANRVIADIERELGTFERTLGTSNRSPVLEPTDLAVILRVDRSGRAMAIEGSPLAYALATDRPAAEPTDAFWQDAEQLEFVERDLSRAAHIYRDLARSTDQNTRAAALLRLARTLKRAGRSDEALRTYSELQQLDRATIAGDPADLMARWARAELVATLNRQDSPVAKGAELDAEFRRGRWQLDRTTTLAYAQLLKQWRTEAEDEALAERVALTDAVATAWQGWRSTEAKTTAGGRRSIRTGSTEVLVAAREADEGLLLFAATPRFLSQAWRRLWTPPNVSVALLDHDGQFVVGDQTANEGTMIVTPASVTGLPWAIRVAALSTPPEVAEAGALRRRLIIAGLVLLALLVPGTGFLAIRAAAKQLTLARQQSEFVSAVSHEFRSPLTSLSHLTSLLRSDFQPSDERRKQYYDVLALETDRLRRFVETLLDFGRMRAGAARYRLQSIDPSAFAAPVVDEFKRHAACGAHRVSFTSDSVVPHVSADVDALGRALWNLLENAAKYSPDDSTIAVRVESASDRSAPEKVAIRVTDHGVGIPAADRPFLFDQFFRGAAATESAIKGTGVGLAVVRHIVSGHGGDIEVDSTVGGGSTFSILLPAVAAGDVRGERRVS